MNYMNGLTTAKILQDLLKSKGIKHTPFFILTAYEGIEYNEENGVDKTYSKPLSFGKIQEMNLIASK